MNMIMNIILITILQINRIKEKKNLKLIITNLTIFFNFIFYLLFLFFVYFLNRNRIDDNNTICDVYFLNLYPFILVFQILIIVSYLGLFLYIFINFAVVFISKNFLFEMEGDDLEFNNYTETENPFWKKSLL
jgi:hypothetical protein